MATSSDRGSNSSGSMWPLTLDLTRDECWGILRRSELETYSSVVGTFRAQGALDDKKAKLLRELRDILHITEDRHKAEARRVANDERLCTVAEVLAGPNTGHDWSKEGRRAYPLLHRSVPQTALLAAADAAQSYVERADEHLPTPDQTARERTLDTTPVDGRTPVVTSDPHVPPKAPHLPVQPAQKPLLKRSAARQASLPDDGAQQQQHERRRMVSESQHQLHQQHFYPHAQHSAASANANMRIQELYHQHINTPQPLPLIGSHPGAPLSAAHQGAVPGSARKSINTKRAQKMTAPGQAKQPRVSKSPRNTGAAGGAQRTSASASGHRSTKSVPTPQAKATVMSPPPPANAQQQRNLAQAEQQFAAAYGNSLKSRKLTYPPDRAVGVADAFPGTSGGGATFVWPPQQSASDPQQPQQIHSVVQTFAPISLQSPPPSTAASSQQQQLTQSSPVQVVFTSSSVLAATGDDSSSNDDRTAQRRSNLITESTPISWVTDDDTSAAALLLAAASEAEEIQRQRQQIVLPAPQPPPPIVVQTTVQAKQPQFIAMPQNLQPLPIGSVHLQTPIAANQQQQQHRPVKVVVQTVTSAPTRKPQMATMIVGQPQQMYHPQSQQQQQQIKATKSAARKKPTTQMHEAAAKANVISVPIQQQQHQPPPQSPIRSAAQPQPIHAPIPASLQQLLDTSLQIHSIHNKTVPQVSTASAASAVPTPTQTTSLGHLNLVPVSTAAAAAAAAKPIGTLPPPSSLNIVHKLQPTSHTSASASAAAPHKPKITITHQEIIPAQLATSTGGLLAGMKTGGHVMTAGSSSGSNIIIGTSSGSGGQLKPMQSKGNVKLVQSANGSLVLRDATSTSAMPRISVAAAPPSVVSVPPVTVQSIGLAAAKTLPSQFPKIQLVKARTVGGVPQKMVLMQKMPAGSFGAASTSSTTTMAGGNPILLSPSPTATSTLNTVTLNKDHVIVAGSGTARTVKIMPSAAARKMVFVSAAGVVAGAAPAAAMVAPKPMTPAVVSAKITEDTPVDILSAAESGSSSSSSGSNAVIEIAARSMAAPAASTVGGGSSSSIVVAGIKHKLMPMATTTSATMTTAVASAAGSMVSLSGTSPMKRIRIDPNKVVKVVSVRPSPAQQTAQMTLKASSGVRPVPQSISTDWEKALDVEAEKRRPVVTQATTTQAVTKISSTAVKVVTASSELIEVLESTDDEAQAPKAVAVAAAIGSATVYGDQYMASDEDIIQYEGDDDEPEPTSDATKHTTTSSLAPTTGTTSAIATTLGSTTAASASSAAATTASTASATTAAAASADSGREEGEADESIVMQMEEVDENGQSHMRNVSLEELVDSGHIVMADGDS